MSYDSVTIANVILKSARAKGLYLTPLQLMKLTYITHGFYMQKNDCVLIHDDIEAWQYGPIIYELYKATRKYGRGVIYDEQLLNDDLADKRVTDDVKILIESVVEVYGKLPGIILSYLANKPGSPWFKVWKPDMKSLKIPNDIIKSHYQDVIDKKILFAA